MNTKGALAVFLIFFLFGCPGLGGESAPKPNKCSSSCSINETQMPYPDCSCERPSQYSMSSCIIECAEGELQKPYPDCSCEANSSFLEQNESNLVVETPLGVQWSSAWKTMYRLHLGLEYGYRVETQDERGNGSGVVTAVVYRSYSKSGEPVWRIDFDRSGLGMLPYWEWRNESMLECMRHVETINIEGRLLQLEVRCDSNESEWNMAGPGYSWNASAVRVGSEEITLKHGNYIAEIYELEPAHARVWISQGVPVPLKIVRETPEKNETAVLEFFSKTG